MVTYIDVYMVLRDITMNASVTEVDSEVFFLMMFLEAYSGKCNLKVYIKYSNNAVNYPNRTVKV